MIEIKDPSVQYRVQNGKLEIKSSSSMLGYLNADSPFTDDGWFITGDQVEEEHGLLRILGRSSEIINVGGEKVFPAEIESILLELPEILDVIIFGEKNPIIGNMVTAKIQLNSEQDQKSVVKKIRQHCRSQLPNFKVPQKFLFVDNINYGQRFKKNRHIITD